MRLPARLLFLPGASGNTAFWRPVAAAKPLGDERIHLGWPGFGGTPPDPGVRGFEDLLQLVLARLDRPTALIAQSMGGDADPISSVAVGRRLAALLPNAQLVVLPGGTHDLANDTLHRTGRRVGGCRDHRPHR